MTLPAAAADAGRLLLLLLLLPGTGGVSAKFGPGNMCKDQTFNGYSCAKGLVCDRQNKYYHQCLPFNGNNADKGRNTAQTSAKTPADNTAKPSTKSSVNKPKSSAKVQALGQQCGGLGAACDDLGGCVDGALSTVKCAPGLSCKTQNKYYWEVREQQGLRCLSVLVQY